MSAIIDIFAFTDGKGFGHPIVITTPPAFFREALFVKADDLRTRIALTEQSLCDANFVLEATALSARETERFVEFATLVDDGEAQALAIASERRVPLLSDDVAGIRLAEANGITVITTLDLAVSWATEKPEAEIRTACQRLRFRARYAVPRNHAHSEWYWSQLQSEYAISMPNPE